MISIHNLFKHYRKKEVLQNINLDIDHGLFGLLGPNGAGKTTLMRILATLLPESSGRVSINHYQLAEQPHEIRKQIGYLPQHFQLYPQLTGVEFLHYIAVMKGMENKKERKEQIDEILQSINLTEQAAKRIKTYSGGMKQRLGIAQALVGDPSVLIIDEPTAGLDPEERVRFRNLLARLSVNRTVILSTHIVADIESSCEQLAVLDQGRMLMSGKVKELRHIAEGKTWEFSVPEQEIQRFHESQIVSSRRSGKEIYLKVISPEKPTDSASIIEPTLEDGYMALIGGMHHD